MKKITTGRIVFQIINYTVLSLLALICLFPLLNILAMSFSSATAVSAGRVLFFPVEFNTYAYSYVIEKKEFWLSLLKSVERVCIGVPLTMLITILVAYPLSKESTQLRARGVYAWIFFFTMLFSGGLIPGYLGDSKGAGGSGADRRGESVSDLLSDLCALCQALHCDADAVYLYLSLEQLL